MSDPKPPTPPFSGSIGSYRVERRLGQGGMGEVFLAYDERLGRPVAIKRIRQGPAQAGLSERFRREARAAVRLSHPAIVSVYDLVEDSSGLAIIMEYVEGRTLADLLTDGLPSPAFALRLARDVAEGLAAAHAAGLVHRDLKAENVLVTAEGRAKILDFGLAKPIAGPGSEESLTVDGAVIGTFHSMSPEQASGSDVDPRSDLFSLGVLLYELLTGRSPFKGSNSLDTLKRVITHHPTPVSALRADLPRRLSDLIERLLAKDREARPRSAAKVAAALGEIAASPELGAWRGAPTGGQERWSELATDVMRPSEIPGSGGTRSRFWRLAVAVAVPTVLGLGAVFLIGRRPSEPLRVAVLAPRVEPAGNEALDLAASGVLMAALSSLSSLEGVAPLDPEQAGAAKSPSAAARAAAAEEVLAATVQGQGALAARVSFRRIQGSDGQVLWAESFDVPTGPRDFRLLADAVAVHLRRTYVGRPLRPGTPELAVRDEDYAELLRIKRRSELGTVPVGPELAKLEALTRRSPRFLEAHLLVAFMAQNLFRSTRDPAYLERGRQAAQTARDLAPGDPRPRVAQLRMALAGNQPQEARGFLGELEKLAPGDPELRVLSGQVAEAEGDLDRAIADLAEAVRRSPSWVNLFRLADLEARAGRTVDARRHLEELLARNPGNVWGLDRLGNLELLLGDPAEAERIYLGLIRLHPQRSHYTNLGLARSLLGRNAEAVAAYGKALELAPGHIAATLNLADAQLALGREAEARTLYGQILEKLAANEAAAELSAMDRMVKAQCLAHLGRPREAVEVTQQALRQSGDDPQVVYAASLVYALVGDRTSALANAHFALERGVQPRWFTIAAFGPLRNDPELRALLR